MEAGLRTYNIYSPFPEEFNRKAVSIISQYNFAPTPFSRNNLLKEGKKPDKVFVTGNTVIDVMQHGNYKNIGFKPMVDIRTGLRKFCEWYEGYR